MMRLNGRKQRGFTLIELLIGMIILGILAAGIAMIASGTIEKGKYTTTRSNLETLKNALNDYIGEMGGMTNAARAKFSASGLDFTESNLSGMLDLTILKEKLNKSSIDSLRDGWGNPLVISGTYDPDTDSGIIVVYAKATKKKQSVTLENRAGDSLTVDEVMFDEYAPSKDPEAKKMYHRVM